MDPHNEDPRYETDCYVSSEFSRFTSLLGSDCGFRRGWRNKTGVEHIETGSSD